MGHYYDVTVITDMYEEIIVNVYALSPMDAEYLATQMAESGQLGTLSNVVISSTAYLWPED